MPGSELDQPAQGELVHLATVQDETGGEALGPILHRNRPQLVKAAELAEGALAGREVDFDDVEAIVFEAVQGGVADAGLARSPRAGDHQVPAAGKRRGDLPHVLTTADQEFCGKRLLRRERLALDSRDMRQTSSRYVVANALCA